MADLVLLGTQKIEIAEGNEICDSEIPLRDVACEKNPGHVGFIPFNALNVEHLPEGCKDQKTLTQLKSQGKRVVRLVVEREEIGPGYVVPDDKGNFYIQTKLSLIGNDHDVENCTIEFRKDKIHFYSKGKRLTCLAEAMTLFTFEPVPEYLAGAVANCRWTTDIIEVKLTVKKFKLGTGWVGQFENKFHVVTNNHVIKSKEEVKNCTIEFNFDSIDRRDVFKSKGTEFAFTSSLRDITCFRFAPVPDFLKDLSIVDECMLSPSVCLVYKNGQRNTALNCSCTIVNFRKEFFINTNLNSPDILNMIIRFPGPNYVLLASHYITFHPVPQNIQSLTHQMLGFHHPEVILHHNGCETHILGKLIYSMQRLVILLAEPLNAEESRNCTIRFPCGLTSKGTGLYFHNVTSIELFKEERGIDRDYRVTRYQDKVWFFTFKPYPEVLKAHNSYLEDVVKRKLSNEVVVIGHPHGGTKMVTFGLHLNNTVEYFNEEGASVGASEGREVTCINYSCLTCPGSSGSVVLFCDSLNLSYSGGYTHFMGRTVNQLWEGQRITNINTAWG